jgi:hypothetical protein
MKFLIKRASGSFSLFALLNISGFKIQYPSFSPVPATNPLLPTVLLKSSACIVPGSISLVVTFLPDYSIP